MILLVNVNWNQGYTEKMYRNFLLCTFSDMSHGSNEKKKIKWNHKPALRFVVSVQNNGRMDARLSVSGLCDG